MGSEQFRQELLAQLTTSKESRFGGPGWYESREQKAQRVLAQELGRRGWTAENLERLAKGHPAKLDQAVTIQNHYDVELDCRAPEDWAHRHLRLTLAGNTNNV